MGSEGEEGENDAEFLEEPHAFRERGKRERESIFFGYNDGYV